MNEADIVDTEEIKTHKKLSIIERITTLMGKTMGGVSSMITGSGMIKGISILLIVLGWVDKNSSLGIMMEAAGNTMFYFMPIMLGYSAAKAVGLSEITGITLGAFLVYPKLIDFQVQILNQNLVFSYANSFLPIILICVFARQIEKLALAYLPELTRHIFTPFIVLAISAPIGFLVIGPLIDGVGGLILDFFYAIYGLSPIIALGLIGMLWYVFVATGIHIVLVALTMANLLNGNPDAIMGAISILVWAQTAAVLAILLKTKKRSLKKDCVSALISGMLGIAEPAVFGITLKRKKIFIISSLGGGLLGAAAAFFNLHKYTLTGGGIFGFLSYIDPATENYQEVIYAIIAATVGFAFTFLATYLVYQDKDSVRGLQEDDIVI